MPERRRPAFHHRRMTMGQTLGEIPQLVGGDDFAAGLFRNAFEQGAIGNQGAKLFRGRIGSPTDFRAACFRERSGWPSRRW